MSTNIRDQLVKHWQDSVLGLVDDEDDVQPQIGASQIAEAWSELRAKIHSIGSRASTGGVVVKAAGVEIREIVDETTSSVGYQILVETADPIENLAYTIVAGDVQQRVHFERVDDGLVVAMTAPIFPRGVRPDLVPVG